MALGPAHHGAGRHGQGQGAGGRARRKPPSSLTRNTGSPTDGFNDKGHHCPFREGTGSNRLNGFGTRYRGSAKDLGVCSPCGVPPHPLFNPFVGTPSRLTASQDFVGGKHVLPQTPSLFAPGAPPSPGAFRFTTSGTAAGVDTGFGRRVSNGVPIQRLASFWPAGVPLIRRPPAQNSKTLADWRTSGGRPVPSGVPPLTARPQTGLTYSGRSRTDFLTQSCFRGRLNSASPHCPENFPFGRPHWPKDAPSPKRRCSMLALARSQRGGKA